MNPRLPRLSSREVVRMLHKYGFQDERQRGSHLVLYHPDGRRAVVPVGKKNVSIGTLKSILKEARIDLTSQ